MDLEVGTWIIKVINDLQRNNQWLTIVDGKLQISAICLTYLSGKCSQSVMASLLTKRISTFLSGRRHHMLLYVPSVAGAGPWTQMLVHPVGQSCHPSLGLWAATGSQAELDFQYGFFCAAYTREEGCLGRGSHHPVTFTFFSWSPSIWGTSGSEEDGCEICRIPCQQQPRLRHWLTMNPAKLIFADYSLNQMNYLVTILKYQFKIHIKIET